MKKLLLTVFELIKIAALAALIVIPIRYFIFQPFFVRGASMEPNFSDFDYLIVDEISYRFREPKRGEVVIFKSPQNPSSRFIKRIIGLPGEKVMVKEGRVFIEDQGQVRKLKELYLPSSISTPGDLELTLNRDQYFVLGDNRPFSSDSRRWGTLPEDKIVGRAWFRLWPLPALAKIDTPRLELVPVK